MINFLFLCFVLTFPSTLDHHHKVVARKTHRVLIQLKQDQSDVNTKVSISQPQVNIDQETLSEKLSKTLKSAGEKVVEVAGNVKTAGENTTGRIVRIVDGIEGALKYLVVKMHEWDEESPRRIWEDIKWNITKNEFLMGSFNTIHDVLCKVPLEEVRLVTIWCHLLGFSIAYGMSAWVTFFSGYVLGKYSPKQQVCVMINKMNMVYIRAMGYCVGVTLLGFLASRGTKTRVLLNKMEMFQVLSLVFAFCMNLINLLFLGPRVTKLIIYGRIVAAEKIKKTNAYAYAYAYAYSLTLNVSTMVMLTWHLAYISQLMQARH